MKKQKSGGEWLDHFQSKVRIYCGKQMIATVHRVMLLSILTKAWNKALEIGYMEKQNELKKTNQLVQAQKEYIKFLHDWVDKVAAYLSNHRMYPLKEDVETGETLRKKIDELESSLLSENQ